jgi:aspartate beta-hydroxylase
LNPQVDNLAKLAQSAMASGRARDAEALWQQVRLLDPKHPHALASLGIHAYQRGDLASAKMLLEQARLLLPRELMVLMTLAIVLRDLGDNLGEDALLTAVLDIDPFFLPALLSVGALVERTQGQRSAAQHYRNALKVAPPENQWPPALRAQLLQAKKKVDSYGEALAAHFESSLGQKISQLTTVEAERWRELGAVLAGRNKIYPSLANQLQIPRLPAIPFFDRALFPWVPEIEAHTDVIRQELHALLAGSEADFRPYIAYEAGTPVNQWHELNHSKRWSSFFLWQHGKEILENSQRCPQTASALKQVDMPQMPGLCPNAMFSALAPKTRIPPHHGETNARLIVHLPLVVPEHCYYRVGFEHRQWQVGQTLIFDDTIEHEARNDSDQLRVVLIFDTWNPLLSAAERDLVQSLNIELTNFHSGPG